MSNKIGFVSLGCPKNLVDSERIITRLCAEGYEIVGSYDEADLVIINTCGFINPSIGESCEVIEEALEINGNVLVTGCLGAKAKFVSDKYPDLVAVTGPHAYEDVMQAVNKVLPAPHQRDFSLLPPQGVRLTPSHYSYLKIAEGCSHRCSFCIIPQLRGDMVSRNPDEIIAEAETLVEAGVRELMVVAQDTSAYGLDLKKSGIETNLYDLCDDLSDLGVWVRVHYMYPYKNVDSVIELMAERKILPYLDIPFQHSNPRILELMKRPAYKEDILQRVMRWREICPDLAIRSSFIAGFPGETEAEFADLMQFLAEAKLDRVGCFAYSDVDGAKANHLPNPVDEDEKHDRVERVMLQQAQISRDKLEQKVGITTDVIVDDITEDQLICRSMWDAPEIDGQVFVDLVDGIEVGDIVPVLIDTSDEHDLWGKVAE